MSNLLQLGILHGVEINVLHVVIVLSDFELPSRYCVHLRTNILGKGMDPYITPGYG